MPPVAFASMARIPFCIYTSRLRPEVDTSQIVSLITRTIFRSGLFPGLLAIRLSRLQDDHGSTGFVICIVKPVAILICPVRVRFIFCFIREVVYGHCEVSLWVEFLGVVVSGFSFLENFFPFHLRCLSAGELLQSSEGLVQIAREAFCLSYSSEIANGLNIVGRW